MSETVAGEATSYELVARLREVHAQIAAAQAEEVELMTRLYRLRRAQQLEAGVAARYAGESAATEIGVAVRVSQRSADGLIALGMGLGRLPATRRAFAQGWIDLARVRAIHDTLVNAPDDTVAELEEDVVGRAERSDPARLRRTIRKKLLELDPAGQARRRREAERERYVAVRAADDGTALVDAVLPAAGGWTLFERLREMAVSQCCAADPRTMNQRRADALVALADGSGRLTCGCALPECARRDPTTPVSAARRALVQVGVSAATLAGVQDNPGLLAGFGAIDADLARQIARHARFHVITETSDEIGSDTTTPHTAGSPTIESADDIHAPAAVELADGSPVNRRHRCHTPTQHESPTNGDGLTRMAIPPQRHGRRPRTSTRWNLPRSRLPGPGRGHRPRPPTALRPPRPHHRRTHHRTQPRLPLPPPPPPENPRRPRHERLDGHPPSASAHRMAHPHRRYDHHQPRRREIPVPARAGGRHFSGTR